MNESGDQPLVHQKALTNVRVGRDLNIDILNQTAYYSNSDMSNQKNREKIKDRDYTLIIDQSPSMGRLEREGSKQSRWDVIKKATIKLAKAIEKYDSSDGITIYTFSDDFTRYDGVDSKKAEEIFKHQKPDEFGATNMGLVLEDALKNYFMRRDEHKTKKNGETFLIVTDGEATDPRKVEEVIIEASKKVGKKGEIGISFIQIGTDEGATTFLKSLDDNLVSPTQATVDIVDTKTLYEIGDKHLEIDDILLDALYD
jgi:hypothetical protein